jgi:stearoyl-CoA desaturase (delta-9 desaturase)
MHLWGTRRYETSDTSRNSFLLALITMGEGWHNNHHYYQSTANQGFFWWELDGSYALLKALRALGLVWDLRTPPAHVLAAHRVRSGPRSTAARREALATEGER